MNRRLKIEILTQMVDGIGQADTFRKSKIGVSRMKYQLLIALLGLVPVASANTLLGPTPYLSFANSPFSGGSFSYFYLETFEDHLLNTPGVSANVGFVTSVVFGGAFSDSVDADDGIIDGSGSAGDSYFSFNGAGGITFTFDAAVLGSLPTNAGIAWTDGGGAVTFQAFGPGHILLGTLGPDSSFPDGFITGQTAEDRFLGIIAPGGVESLFVSNTAGGIEVDHLQYGLAQVSTAGVPEPGSLLLIGYALCVVSLKLRKHLR